MTEKESNQLDFVLFNQVVCGARDVDLLARLNAFAYDMHLIRTGEHPTATKELAQETMSSKH